MVRMLLDHGARADSAATNGLRPLHLAAQEDRLHVAEALVIETHGQVDPQTKVTNTAFHSN